MPGWRAAARTGDSNRSTAEQLAKRALPAIASSHCRCPPPVLLGSKTALADTGNDKLRQRASLAGTTVNTLWTVEPSHQEDRK